MLEILIRAAVLAAGLSVLSTLTVWILRRVSVVGPLLDAERRRALWLRVPALFLWLTAVLLGAWYVNDFLSNLHEWAGWAAGGIVGVALVALGIGVALL